MEKEKREAPSHVLQTPIWMLAIRIVQLLLSLIIVGMAGKLMHDAYLDECGLALAISLFTWIITAYIVLSEKLPALHKLYNIIAVLALDGFMIILWLATFAAVAAERGRYNANVNVSGCSDDGTLISSKTCSVVKREPGVLLFKSGLIMMSAIAGLGALIWLLFIAAFIWEVIMFQRGRKEGRFALGAKNDNYQMSPKPQTQPFIAQQQQAHQPMPGQDTAQYQQPQHTGQPIQPQHTGLYQHQPSPAGTYSPPPAGTYPPPAQYPQQPVSPQNTGPHDQGPYAAPSELSTYGQPQQQQQQHQGQYQQGHYQQTGNELPGSEGQQYHEAPTPPPQGGRP